MQPSEEPLVSGEDGKDDERSDAGRKLKIAGVLCCGCYCLLAFVVIALTMYMSIFIGPAIHDDLDSFRSEASLSLEAQRREAAKGTDLLTADSRRNAFAYGMHVGTNALFPYFNFVQGFQRPGLWNGFVHLFHRTFGIADPKWKPPVKGESVEVVSYQEFARRNFKKEFPYEFFDHYYTGGAIPSWEDNSRHAAGVKLLDASVKTQRALGAEPIDILLPLEPRLAFDHRALMKTAWDGFRYMGPLDIQYASNGFYGVAVVEALMEKYNTSGEVLGILMTDSVFSAHLVQDKDKPGTFGIDLTSMEKYKPIEGYAAMGGKATFVEDNGRLRTTKLVYGGKTYTEFDVPEVASEYMKSKRVDWRFAEGAIISSLLSQTNLVMHVKDLHLELAAAFQAVTVKAFSGEPAHPVRRLLDPFVHRSMQATNDNFKLLFEYHAAMFSLAPLPTDEQLKLIDEAIRDRPLNLHDFDLKNFAARRNMDTDFSTRAAMQNSSRWGWRWHYRALTVQGLYEQLIDCWLAASYGGATGEALDSKLANDGVLQAWWNMMVDHLPSLSVAATENPEWAGAANEPLTAQGLNRAASTLMVWLSWIHEDVGHSAASLVYNPVYTPMCVPEDGVGVPLRSWMFNAAAYRGFVFLHRPTLLEEPPDFWFDGSEGCRHCFTDMQESLRKLGQEDPAFSECDEKGFYSCVGRVETAVSS